MTNRYGGECSRCNGWVEPNQGTCEKNHLGQWIVFHAETRDCAAAEAAAKQPAQGLDVSGLIEGLAEANGTFYQIDKPTEGTWNGWTFIKVIELVSDGNRVRKNKIRRAGSARRERPLVVRSAEDEANISLIVQDPMAAAIRVGKNSGICGICGRLLTDATSVAAGIGPVCAENLGIDQDALAAERQTAVAAIPTMRKPQVIVEVTPTVETELEVTEGSVEVRANESGRRFRQVWEQYMRDEPNAPQADREAMAARLIEQTGLSALLRSNDDATPVISGFHQSFNR